VAGTPAQVTEALLCVVKRCARRLTVNFADAPPPDGTRLFSAEVLPHLFSAPRLLSDKDR